MRPSEMTQALSRSTTLAERVLLRVEELELLVNGDRPRRLIDLAQAELANAVAEANDFWAAQEAGLAEEAASCEDHEVRQIWLEFRSLLVHSARRAAEASSAIAGRLAVCDDAMAALGVHREYTGGGEALPASKSLPKSRAVLA